MIPENPIETMHVYAAESQYLKGPDPAAQAAGTVPLDTLPADWWNWLWQEITKRINEASKAVGSIHTEILSVLQAASITPSEVSTSDLLKAIRAITRTIGNGNIAGAVKSSTESGYVAIDSNGYMSPNGMGIPTTLNTTAKQIVGAINEVLASLNTYKTSTDDALTGLTNSKAPNNHASTDTTYGTGSDSKYGHVKLSDSTSSTSGVSGGIAATPAAVKAVKDSLTSNVTSLTASISGKAPKMHASTATTYGTGTSSQWGHVKLSNSISSTSSTGDGIAATPSAVKAVNDSLTSNVSSLQSAIDGKAPTMHAIDVPIYGASSSSQWGHVKLSDSVNSSDSAENGIAATPAAVKAVKDLLDSLKTALTLPSGIVAPFAGSTIPSGWLLCNGQAVSRESYASLFSAIGTTYGVGDGSTTFNVPDLRECNPVGVGKRASGVTNHNELTLGAFQDDQYQQHSHDVAGDTGSTQPTFTGTAHSHNFTPQGKIGDGGCHYHFVAMDDNSSYNSASSSGTDIRPLVRGTTQGVYNYNDPVVDNYSELTSIGYPTNKNTVDRIRAVIDGEGAGWAYNTYQKDFIGSFQSPTSWSGYHDHVFIGTKATTGEATAEGSVSSHAHSLSLTTSDAGTSAGGTHGKLLGMNYIIKT